MAFERTSPIKVNLGTTRLLRFQVYDVNGASIVISSATYRLLDIGGADVVDSGSCTVNNADTNAAGETINTIQPVLDFSATDLDIGQYWLVFFVTLSTTESQVLRQLIEVVEWWVPAA
jgi:hypothetical protein